MKVDAIIFDKDGTLIDFDAFWVKVSRLAIEKVIREFDVSLAPVDEILSALGVNDGVTDIDGILCKGTYMQIAKIICDILTKYGCRAPETQVIKAIIDAYNENSDAGDVKPTCADLVKVLSDFKACGKKLAVVTTDNEYITRKCLTALGVIHLFDKIYTDDGIIPTKPNPFCEEDFCKNYNLSRDRVIMVGDTMTDVKFALNAGIKVIGVAKSKSNADRLSPHADMVISKISALKEIVE